MSLLKKFFSTSSIKTKLQGLIQPARQRLLKLKKQHGQKVLGQIKAEQVFGGMRGIPGLIYETSKLDPNQGIRYRGRRLIDLQQKYQPHAPPIQAAFWLLLTGEFPTQQELTQIKSELQERAKVPIQVEILVKHLPREMHPMTKLSIGALALQPYSLFQKAYSSGIHKSKYWEHTLEDGLNLCAKISKIAAIAYVNTYKKGGIPQNYLNDDYSAAFSKMMGYEEKDFHQLMRLYLTIHADHEGGNVSAHATQLVSSALSDPYYAYSAGMNGLAGPLHGLANQEVLKWLLQYRDKYGDSLKQQDIKAFTIDTLKSGSVVPGFGHAVLRQTDHRYMCQQRFAMKYLSNDHMFQLVKTCYDVIPKVLNDTGKIKNPWPNVDAHSGVLLQYYGMKEYDFYTVLFGVSRAFGTMSALVWSRALGLPIERPNSNTLQTFEELLKKAN